MLISWDKLPYEMKNSEVKAYYDILSRRKGSLAVKRIFDIIASLLMLVLLSWLFLILAIMIKVDSRGPVFYRQVRVTTGNRDFRIFKFRTMVQNADKIGALVTSGNDSRITRVGSSGYVDEHITASGSISFMILPVLSHSFDTNCAIVIARLTPLPSYVLVFIQ